MKSRVIHTNHEIISRIFVLIIIERLGHICRLGMYEIGIQNINERKEGKRNQNQNFLIF